MKFSINATDFRAALKAACEVAPSKGILPEYSCVFLQADEGENLRIYARSESMEFSVTVPCDVQDDGEALIPSRMLLDYVSLASGDVQISTDAKQKMTIKSGKKTSSIVGMDTDRFKAPAFSGEDVLRASGADFAACLNRTSFCTSLDETRPQLCGVHLSIDSIGHVKFVGMDGYRISMCDMDKTELLADLPQGREITIPNAVLKLIPSLFSGDDAITLGLETYRASISANGKMLIFPLIAKEYIQYGRLLTNDYKTELLLNSDAFLEALRLVEIASGNAEGNDQRKNLIRIQTDGENGCVTLSADNAATDAVTVVDCDLRGEDMTIYFNVKYVKDLAAVCAKESDAITFSLTGPVSIASIAPQNSQSRLTTYVVPVRTRN